MYPPKSPVALCAFAAYTPSVQAPLLVFDHINKKVTTIPTGPGADKRIAEIVAAQRDQVATSGRPT